MGDGCTRRRKTHCMLCGGLGEEWRTIGGKASRASWEMTVDAYDYSDFDWECRRSSACARPRDIHPRALPAMPVQTFERARARARSWIRLIGACLHTEIAGHARARGRAGVGWGGRKTRARRTSWCALDCDVPCLSQNLPFRSHGLSFSAGLSASSLWRSR